MEISIDLFQKLKSFSEPELQQEILKHGKILKAKKGDILIKEGQYLNFLPIVIQGQLRVYQEKEDREILLYYVGPEQT
jgi:CRP/FNR family transcriptional regulator, anaerobic regulatory protein